MSTSTKMSRDPWEPLYQAESQARDILSAEGVDFGEEMTWETEDRLIALTQQIMSASHDSSTKMSPVPESPFFIRDRGVLHHVEPLTKPSRTNSTVLVRATRFGTLMRVEHRDLIRNY